jgi:hypothetical protein
MKIVIYRRNRGPGGGAQYVYGWELEDDDGTYLCMGGIESHNVKTIVRRARKFLAAIGKEDTEIELPELD